MGTVIFPIGRPSLIVVMSVHDTLSLDGFLFNCKMEE